MNELLEKFSFLPADKSIPSLLAWARGEMKKSRFKIWLRAFLFVQFSAIFCVYFYRDISAGYFRWEWVGLIYLLCVPLGFWMSRIVPMRADSATRAALLSLDRVYLVLIWVLVIAKLVAAHSRPGSSWPIFLWRSSWGSCLGDWVGFACVCAT